MTPYNTDRDEMAKHHEWVAETSDKGHRSFLGRGCCQECGLPAHKGKCEWESARPPNELEVYGLDAWEEGCAGIVD